MTKSKKQSSTWSFELPSVLFILPVGINPRDSRFKTLIRRHRPAGALRISKGFHPRLPGAEV